MQTADCRPDTKYRLQSGYKMQTENFKSFYHWVLLHNFSILWRRKKKDDKKTKAFYDWATTGIPIKSSVETSLGPFLSATKLATSQVTKCDKRTLISMTSRRLTGTFWVNSEIALETHIVLSYVFLENNSEEVLWREMSLCHSKAGGDLKAISFARAWPNRIVWPVNFLLKFVRLP